jgi:hypothetical protein
MTNQFSSSREAVWPWASILILGTFGLDSPGARRYQIRTGLALLALVLLFPGSALLFGVLLPEVSALRWLPPLVAGTSFALISYEMWRYVSGLDELSRMLQLQAMSLTYLVGFTVFATAHFFAGASGWSWHVPALAYIGLELVRALVLAVLVRKFR